METVRLRVDGTGRLDSYVSERFPDVSRSYVRKLILEGDVLLNGGRSRPGQKVRPGDLVEGRIPDPARISAEPQDIPLDILYEDADIIVVNKPRGMVTHPAPGSPDGTLVNALLHHAGDLSGVGGALRPGIVHRLDRDTSGVLVVAKNDPAHRELSRQLQEREMEKRYAALVVGVMKDDEGTVRARLARSRRDYKKMTVDPAGREAVTHYRVVSRFPKHTLLDVRLETGRTHQIRAHMRHVGHPVAGDPVYGPKEDPLKLEGQFLHAKSLAFTHPTTGAPLQFEAPLPEKLEAVLARLERSRGS